MNGGVHSLDAAEARAVLAEYERSGLRVFSLPDTITSKDDFFDAVRGALPLDPPLQSNRSWDALEDSLWSGLRDLDEKEIAIVWPNASAMAEASPDQAIIARSVFEDLASSLTDERATVGKVKHLSVLMVD